MFTVCENGGTFKVTVDGTDVGELMEGDMFGETALLLKRPRSSTVTCASPTCRILEMRGDDFLQLISNSPEWVEKSFRDLSRRREFKKALLLTGKDASINLKDLFNRIDTDNDGRLSLAEVKTVLLKFDPGFPETELVALVESMDLDGNGYITWKEFKRVVGQGIR